METIGQALLITLGLLVVSITLVGLAMWGLYKFFAHSPNSETKQKNKF